MTILQRFFWWSTGANMLGALVTMIYLNVLAPIPRGQDAMQRLGPASLVLSAGVIALAFLVAAIDAVIVERRVKVWDVKLAAGLDAVHVPVVVRRAVLDYVPRTALRGLVVWALAALLAWLVLGRSFLQAAVGVFGVGGILSTGLTYYVGDLIWRPMVARFFPAGALAASGGFRVPIFLRLLIVFLLIGLYPSSIIVRIARTRVEALVTAQNPEAILRNLLLSEIYVIVAAMVLGTVLALSVARSIVRPLHELRDAMKRVENSDFAAKVSVVTNDEIGYLGERFNQMTEGLRRGELMRSLFGLYVTPEVARAAVEEGAVLGGKTAECTVLFSDVRDFTGLSERTAPQELIAMLNGYFEGMVAAITQHSGMVNKFGGDSILAVFGTPLNPAIDHAARGVRAGLAMLEALDRFNAAQRDHQGTALAIGIGIATGAVVAGNVGGTERLEYTVIGDTVNLASRLQSATKELGHTLLVSASTYRAVAATAGARFVHIPGVTVKGKSEPLDVYAVLCGEEAKTARAAQEIS
ncbi:MAG: HAMP domain-containing protein [Candidatus Schekmanbacteria bacterium]|nr:HAMP domain-containing protein [Candidatus Schekmanbacteria bacterium]